MFKKKLVSFLTSGALLLSLGAFAFVGNVSATAGTGIGNTIRSGINGSGGLNDVANDVYGTAVSDRTLEGTVVSVINGILGLLGIIFLVLVLYAGFLWMTAAGNEDQVTKAKSILTTSIIGIVIIVAAYAIVKFVLDAIFKIN
ncbi:hypothetical protein A3G56_03175 [Candidatus Falkowbacteria bacterium RIFCSPLOWO2_12_FULL_45_10]|uniref:Uncharacterized protein n=3 Tax=Candidatus Falkowiibacteriota TaxID=1752728 RepID=A0A1F5RMI0_9BACT|nr:MAG: hypothetical protein A3D54_00355 [Candidatus Falkowbacteria bacterium RIFCSPHIGHO2_02_FULL_45_15]OGF18409.1 MAG: hypothetical protein A3G56_03175 [Candidatus Falkowbacteria bacterium RIFCSPLOWO2_12_FULL_45_10]OGF19657.1 MAG: hypothetical protein A3I35_02640 [Candidatus Falkowbacteria bacterium RIFCSPLOWO2_02_FULL_45_15]